MKQAKRWLSGLLAALLVVGLLPATAGAYSMGMQGTAQTVAAGQFHSLAVKADGSLWAWGWNGSGQLGDGTTEDRHAPIKVMDNVTAVAAGDGFSLAVKTDGSLWAWGYGLEGVRSTPAKVLDNVAAVSAGHSHALAVKTDGSAWAWGWNDYGQLGDGTTTKRAAPVKIMDDVMAVAAGYADSLAIQTDGSLWAWGATAECETPKRMLENVAAASIGINHTVAVMPNGEWWAWGQNDSGQLGSGSHAFDAEMYGYKMADNAVASTAGNAYTLVVKADDSLWGWGANSLGQLGAGVKGTQFSPVKVTENVVTASAGYNHSLVLKTDGSLWASGCNEDYQLGDGTQTSRGTLVKVMDDVKLPGTSSVTKPVSPQEPSSPGTSQAVGDNTSSGAAEKPPTASRVEDVEMIRSFDFSGGTDYESAEITGTDAQGNEVWTYTTDRYVATECARTGEIGVYQGMYLFFDGGAITALDVQTGDVAWRNGDYGGTGTAYLIDGDTLYACGQYGPDFYAIDMAGNNV